MLRSPPDRVGSCLTHRSVVAFAAARPDAGSPGRRICFGRSALAWRAVPVGDDGRVRPPHASLETTTMTKGWRGRIATGLGMLGLLVLPSWAGAEEAAASASAPAATAAAPAINGADTAFVLVSAALVMLMTPGLGLFYGGMVRRKNVLATFQQSFIMLGVVAIQWVLFGYSLAFGPDMYGGLIGSLDWVGLRGVGPDAATRLRRDDPAPALHGLPAHVRGDHPGADLRGVRRADEVLGLPALHAALGDVHLRPRGALGLGHRRLDQGAWVRSTSPAGWSCTSSRASRRSAACS